MGLWDSLIGAGATLYGTKMQVEAQEDTNKQNERLLRESWGRDDTSYQRAAADLEAAGINPLMAGQFGGASSGQLIQLQNPMQGAAQAGAEIGNIVQRGAELRNTERQTTANIIKSDYEIDEIASRIKLQSSGVSLNKQEIKKKIKETDKIIADTKKAIMDTGKSAEEIRKLKSDISVNEIQKSLFRSGIKLNAYKVKEMKALIDNHIEQLAQMKLGTQNITFDKKLREVEYTFYKEMAKASKGDESYYKGFLNMVNMYMIRNRKR